VLAQAARWKSLLTGQPVEPRAPKVSLGGGGHGDGGID